MPDSQDTVLVTGGSGFLGSWCVAELLARGYRVRTTVRSAAREADVRSAVSGAGADPDAGLEFAIADLTKDDGWAEAVAGCRYVLHVASPFPPKQPEDPDELIVPARDGTLRVLKAALDADVDRIVVTSSVASIRGSRANDDANPLTEADWTDGANTANSPYVRSKATAERAAWDFVQGEGKRDRLATVCPGAIIGPALDADTSFSLQAISRLMGGTPAIPRIGFTFVDVRDVADLEIRAMTSPEAGGERFIAADQFLWFSDVAAILRERLPADKAKKVPTRNAPNLLIKVMGLFDPSIRSIVGDLGVRTVYSSEKARTKLGWQPRSVADSITETAESLLEHGVVSG